MDEEIFRGGIFNDDGSRIDPNLVPIPPLCLSCSSYGLGGEEEILCTLNRADQAGETDFECGAYQEK
ncbi:MAG: hypothetical protein ACLFVQ_06670 [Chitinispirillaceae bacterium]